MDESVSDVRAKAMGTPSKMHAFRKRKGTPVPWNVEQHNEESLQRSTRTAEDTSPAGETQVPDSVRDVISSPGQSLDADIQRTMEDKMGDSFSDVQIHTGPRAAQACEDINARAFTVGNHVAFNQGEYDPSSAEGQHTLAHELAHVRQQTGGAVSMLPQENLDLEIDPDPELEQEAEETAQRVMQGGELGIQRMSETDVHVQRESEGGLVDRARGLAETGKEKLKDVAGTGKEKVDEATTKKYQLTKDQLTDLVNSVETEKGLAEYMEYHNIEPVSSIQESASSGTGGALKAGKGGAKVGGFVGGIPGAVAGAIAAAPLGFILATKYGKETADKIQTVIRDQLDLSTEQEFDTDAETGQGADPYQGDDS